MRILSVSILPVGFGPECWGLAWMENEDGKREPVLCGPVPTRAPGDDDKPTRNQLQAIQWAKARAMHIMQETNDIWTEPTRAGLQYVMPGCEKDQSRGPAQMSLF